MAAQHQTNPARRLSAGALLLAACLVASAPAGAREAEATAERAVVSLHKARTAVVERLDRERSTAAVSSRQRDEALLFVSYLDGRIHHYCRQLFLSTGPAGLEGLPCPAAAAGEIETGRFAPVPESAGQTRTERVAQLDRELNSALGAFDDMLLQEEEAVAARIPRQRESGGTASGGSWEGPSADPGDEGAGRPGAAGGEPGRDAGSSVSAPETADPAAGRSPGSSPSAPTAGGRELETGDDDIVARQLREAAEQETDPEVKERLWEEYRKYKEGIR